jgi:hypothetical protein
MEMGAMSELNESTWGVTCDEFVTIILSEPRLNEFFSEKVNIRAKVAKYWERRFERISTTSESL